MKLVGFKDQNFPKAPNCIILPWHHSLIDMAERLKGEDTIKQINSVKQNV